MPRKKSDKRLTFRQVERIRSMRAARSGCRVALEGGVGEPGVREEGRVVAHFGLNVEVESVEGRRFRCAVRETLLEDPVCGDWVVWQRIGETQGVIVEVRERTTVLQRPGPYQRLLTVVANVDRIVVVAAGGNLNTGLLDRYLAAACKADIDAMLVVNKSDLVTDPIGEERALAPYERMGYVVLRVSALLGMGLEPLESALRERTSVLVGESGVGKSSLVNCWTSGAAVKTSEVHPATGQGRHVTTTAQLYRLPGGGVLIDSPGVREFGLHGVEREVVPGLFRDVAPYLGQCRFSDCRHQQEPGCALHAAVLAGEIALPRLESMRR
ncbi:MAG: ribosome small subunit-dependent GTPase A, partial [Magnetococcales bacterium]|nr:ribosome small subunit-dependent GTPase A [Magnetococcales bacterium]